MRSLSLSLIHTKEMKSEKYIHTHRHTTLLTQITFRIVNKNVSVSVDKGKFWLGSRLLFALKYLEYSMIIDAVNYNNVDHFLRISLFVSFLLISSVGA